MVTFTTWKGIRVTPWMSYQLTRLDHDIFDAFGVRIGATSGIRTDEEQLDIWYDRYVTAGNVRGRRVYDTRWWNGQLWYRVSPAGTVAQPGTSNHQIQNNGTRAAVDLYDTGSDAGITSRWSVRGQWLRRNAHKYDLVASGDGFQEGWHFDINNINKTPPGPAPKPTPKPTPAPTKRKRKKMSNAVIHTNEGNTAAGDKGRRGAIVNWEAATFSPFGWFSISYANGVAKGHGLEASGPVTDGHYDQIKRDIAAKAARDGKVFVDIDDDDVPQIKA